MVPARGLVVTGRETRTTKTGGPKIRTHHPPPPKPDEDNYPGDVVLYAGRLSPTDKVVIAYLGVVAALVVISRGNIKQWWLVVSAHAIVAVLLVTASRIRVSRATNFARAWYPLVLMPLSFKELTYLIPLIHPRDFDWELASIDYRMFSLHPTVWLERFTHPLITELLQLSYITYYFMPLLLGIVLWREHRFERFHFVLFVIVLGFYLSYLGYITVPAIGPRFILADQQTIPLTGVWSFSWIRTTLDRAEGITRDCFPSGHTELTVLVLYYARRYKLRVFWGMLPAGIALIISTVYLRYHYVIDVIAGVLLAVIVIALSRILYRIIGGLQENGN